MKLNRIKNKTKKQIELHLIKSKIYEHSPDKRLVENNLTKIITSLKKALVIIFNFNKLKKRILFVGAPKEIEKKINNETIHSSIPSFSHVKNTLLNKSILNGLKLKARFTDKSNLSKMSKRPDLIVVLKSERSNSLIDESFSCRIPIIQFEYNEKEHFIKQTYNVTGNFKSNHNKTIDNNIFLILINSLLNKNVTI